MSMLQKEGSALIERMFGPQGTPTPFMKEMIEITERYLFGEIWRRPCLTLRERSLVTIAVLASQGRERQLRNHIRASFNNSVTADDLKELMIHMANYGGWACAMTGLIIAEEVIADRAKKKPVQGKKRAKR